MCIFCKIINQEIPSFKVYEDDKTLAFLDIKPVKPGHTLVISKKHYQNLEETTPEDLNALALTVKKVGLIMKEKLGAPGYNVCENNDPVAGQIISHVHFHVIPRQVDDGLSLWPQKEYAAGEAEEILKKLTA